MKPPSLSESASAAANEKPMTTIERMARAIVAVDLNVPGSAPGTWHAGPDAAKRMAIAVLQVLREPGEGAIRAMAADMWDYKDDTLVQPIAARSAFTAAIDHIIGEGDHV